MHQAIFTLLDRLEQPDLRQAGVLEWACPIPAFGEVAAARVATVGINPSDREFVDASGQELDGAGRRFHTLRSLKLERWSQADARHVRAIATSCQAYFTSNPYDQWFRRLDRIVSGTSTSYYDRLFPACHLDLVPYATSCKWSDLSNSQRGKLLSLSGDSLALNLRNSPIRLLVLNGRTVVNEFMDTYDVQMESQERGEWSLPRKEDQTVKGVAYYGEVDELCGIPLDRSVYILGFNHNIQSSYGVTNEVVNSIRTWVSRAFNSNLR